MTDKTGKTKEGRRWVEALKRMRADLADLTPAVDAHREQAKALGVAEGDAIRAIEWGLLAVEQILGQGDSATKHRRALDRTERVGAFIQQEQSKHTKPVTYTQIARAAKTGRRGTGSFQDWISGVLPDKAVVSTRVELVLRGVTPITAAAWREDEDNH